jgi:hypothetical protein
LPLVTPITVVETREFLGARRKLMDDTERAEFVEHLAFNPTAGDVIPGAGGVRKIRWGLEGRGKRDGARVIFFFHDRELPLDLPEVYATDERTNLAQAECNQMRQVTRQIMESYRQRRAGR